MRAGLPLIIALMLASPAAGDTVPAPASAISAVGPGRNIGLYAAQTFRLADGRCQDCPTIRQALWYFERETIAVPRSGLPVAAFTPGVRAVDDVRAWAAARAPGALLDYPPLVWVAAPQVAANARLTPDATTLTFAGHTQVPFRLAPKIPLNRSYFDGSSAIFFSQRPIKVRGTLDEGQIVARTLWPEDFRLDPAPPRQALAADLPPAEALRARVRALPQGGAQSPFAASTLWQRSGTSESPPVSPGRPVIGIMVNGAQGDDDEAHGGHFALITGRTQADGAIGDWLVNNFYSLDVESEKGILAAPLPLDDYLADLNSGQGYYRPSYMIVAVLRDERAPALLQSALNRVYNQFYRHQLVYQHATMNCASISVDVMRALGWEVPARGATSRLLGAVGFPYFLATERSLAKAKTAYDYLVVDQTRLMPAAAFEEAGASLLSLVGATGTRVSRSKANGRLAQMLAEDVETIAFVRFPQFPSSRAFGNAPAVTTWEYKALVPADPAEAQIVAVPSRPFPDKLRDPDLLPPPRRPSDTAAMVWALLALGGIPWLGWRLWQRWRRRKAGGTTHG
jgi:hypothetical protein